MSREIRILVADDEAVIRTGCERILSEEGYRVGTATDGADCVERLRREPFDLVLLDMMMPGLDCAETLSRIREVSPKTAIVVVSGYATAARVAEVMKRGACDFVAKPFLPEEIRAAVRGALRTLGDDPAEAVAAPLPDCRSAFDDGSEAGGFREALESIESGAVITDRDGWILYANPAAGRLLEFGDRDARGESLLFLLPDKAVADVLRHTADEGVAGSVECPPAERRARHLAADLTPLRLQPDGPIEGTVVLLTDVTATRKADRQRSEFVGKVVHELRAPLATVQQLVYFLRDEEAGPLADVQRDLLTRIQVRLGEMLDLVKNLLNLMKLEAGTLAYRLEPVALQAVLSACVFDFTAAATAKRIRLELNCPEDIPVVLGDRENLKTAFRNLIGNAVKYTKEDGEVEVSVRAVDEEVEVSVRDTGIGIPENALGRIFDKFYRVDDEQTRWITGSGLGLALTKGIVETQGGRIEVESVYGKGSIFRVRLPISR